MLRRATQTELVQVGLATAAAHGPGPSYKGRGKLLPIAPCSLDSRPSGPQPASIRDGTGPTTRSWGTSSAFVPRTPKAQGFWCGRVNAGGNPRNLVNLGTAGPTSAREGTGGHLLDPSAGRRRGEQGDVSPGLGLQAGPMPRRKDIPPWVKVPEDLRDPEVLQVQTALLEAMFGPGGSRIPYIEQVSRAMLELKVLESSNLTEVVVYGNYLYKLRTKWMLQSMAERHRLRQERGMLRLEDAMSALELGL
ncbi:PREDICTED: developmental pluripotency-associated 5 protein [Myotis brandtii]|uniref:developmental pluripotency-associated 5 protein n=1 Tax=Myotis brandtii TaxID=109478 RepID=UPI0003BB8A8A|nr:PREDICTED: developmental pluripotency-associated 5 protein [Myotis brandtii]